MTIPDYRLEVIADFRRQLARKISALSHQQVQLFQLSQELEAMAAQRRKIAAEAERAHKARRAKARAKKGTSA